MGARLGEEARHLFLDQPASAARGHFALLAVLVDQLLQIVDTEQVHVLEVGHRRLDVPRHGQIHHENGPPAPGAHGRGRGGLGDQGYGACGAADDDVGVHELGADGVETDGIGLEFRGERLRPGEAAVGDHHAPHAGRGEMPCGEADHLAGAHQQRGAGAQIRVDAARETDRRGGDRDGVGADAGLGADALGGRKGGLEELVERRAGAAALLGKPVRFLQLAEDLGLAEHHGIEAGGNVEGVLDSAPLLVDVQARREIDAVAVVPLEPLREFRAARRSRPIELGAVASGQNHDLGHADLLAQGAQGEKQTRLVEGHPLAQRNRGGLMVDSEDIERHAAF